ncbi:MAG: translation initiation factor IF-2 N-terminal domain-containing protein, partial [Eubacteriales bacterium]
MAKMKVHELAKELNIQSKDIVSYLQKEGVEVKAAQSSIEDGAISLAKKHFGHSNEVKSVKVEAPNAEASKADTPKVEVPKTERVEKEQKKKKNIIFVSNPQNSKIPGGQKPPVRNNVPEQKTKPVTKQIQLGPNQMINKATGKVMEMLPPKKPEVVVESKPEVVVPKAEPVKPEVSAVEKAAETKVVTNEVVKNEDRPQYNNNRPNQNGDRPQYNNNRPNQNGDRPQYNNNRPNQNGDRPQYNNNRNYQNGDRPQYNNNRPNQNGDRPQYNNN